MKHFFTILSFIVVCNISYAQNDKPSIDETISFIKGYYDDKSFESYVDDCNTICKNYSIDFNKTNSIMQFYWEEDFGVRNERLLQKNRFTIDLSKIESINLHIIKTPNNERIYLVFDVAKGKNYKIRKEEAGGFGSDNWSSSLVNSGEMTIMIGCVNCSSRTEMEKLKKAFNHLRKLCGAPEPINFD